MSTETPQPFGELGQRLRLLRERIQETLEDASGAAEIDPPMLQAYEDGTERPDEDILHVLLHHFDVSEDDAEELWRLAGYQSLRSEKGNSSSEDGGFQPTPAMFVLPIDGRILYSDMVHVGVNKQGVVLNFMQNVGPDNKIMPVSRVGMSKDHARALIQLLQDCLDHSEPKQLPEEKDS
ncbi:helix-turn-helix domain-containing protein [Candidatus Saccharibacteria bacterium]|nr:helix-turn-helix domain-containing protein [Candidatus Saccharibacteria bacterium]